MPGDTMGHPDGRAIGRSSIFTRFGDRTVTAMSRTRTITGAGVIATAALVLLFGNQAVTEWIARHRTTNSLWGWFLRRLSWPSWILGPREDSASGAFRNVLAEDLRALFLVALRRRDPRHGLQVDRRGWPWGFFLGWAALIFASALAAFLTAFIIANPTFLGALAAAQGGSAYGLFVGWLVGIATATAKKAALSHAVQAPVSQGALLSM